MLIFLRFNGMSQCHSFDDNCSDGRAKKKRSNTCQQVRFTLKNAWDFFKWKKHRLKVKLNGNLKSSNLHLHYKALSPPILARIFWLANRAKNVLEQTWGALLALLSAAANAQSFDNLLYREVNILNSIFIETETALVHCLIICVTQLTLSFLFRFASRPTATTSSAGSTRRVTFDESVDKPTWDRGTQV